MPFAAPFALVARQRCEANGAAVLSAQADPSEETKGKKSRPAPFGMPGLRSGA